MPFLIIAPVGAAKPAQGEIVVDASGAVAGTLNGTPARLQIIPNGSKVPVLNPDAAARIGLKSGWLNIVAVVGPVRIKGSTAVIRYTAPGTQAKRRIGWFDRPAAPGFDALLGPGAIAAPVVTFRLHPENAGEVVHRLPLIDDGYGGMGSAVMIGKTRLLLRWTLDKAETTANAKAGEVIQAERGGQWTGSSRALPVAFGVHRPHRRFDLARPLAIGGFPLPALFIRTTGTDTESTDPDEIVVTARKKTKGTGVIIFGRDALSACSSLTFDKTRKEIRVSCRG
jgi:hypothetical protein